MGPRRLAELASVCLRLGRHNTQSDPFVARGVDSAWGGALYQLLSVLFIHERKSLGCHRGVGKRLPVLPR